MIKYLLNSRTGEKTNFKTALRYGVVGSSYAFSFDCENSELFSAYSEDNEPIYLGDVVEVFIGIGKNPRKYYEIEVAPNGTKFFAEITNDGGDLKVKFSQVEIKTEVERFKNGYKATIYIPETLFSNRGKKELYFNAFRIETEGGETEKNLLALSPTLSDTFHDPSKFIPLEED